MDKFTTITVEQHDAIEVLSLDRPDALNAVTPAMADELIAYFSGLHTGFLSFLEIEESLWKNRLPRISRMHF